MAWTENEVQVEQETRKRKIGRDWHWEVAESTPGRIQMLDHGGKDHPTRGWQGEATADDEDERAIGEKRAERRLRDDGGCSPMPWCVFRTRKEIARVWTRTGESDRTFGQQEAVLPCEFGRLATDRNELANSSNPTNARVAVLASSLTASLR
jgi:hypothetical protein